MIPVSLTLRGFKGILSGMGIEEVSIDFSSLPDGLIAICGQTGGGKTTLMDNMHPYRLQPFKARKAQDWSPGAFSYYDQCYGSDARKEFVFDMNGVRYKSLILIDADKRKQEAYLYRGGLGSRDWQPLNDGKTRTYDEAVEKICGSPTLFFTSVFRAQSARSLADYKRSEIVSVLSELLNIDHIRQQGDKCRQVVSSLQGKLDIVRSKLSDMESDAAVTTDLQHAICEEDSLIAEEHMRLDFAKKELEVKRAEISGIRERAAAAASNRERIMQLRSQIASEMQRMSEAEKGCTAAEADFDRRITALRSAQEVFVDSHNHRVARANKILSGAEQIREAVSREPALVDTLVSRNQRLDDARELKAQRKEAVAKLEVEKERLFVEVSSLESSIKKLDGVECENQNCRFIADALNARYVLPGKIEARNDVQRRLSDLYRLVEASDAEVPELIDAVDRCAAELEECRKFTRLLPELEISERNLAEWTAEFEEKSKQCESDIKTLEGEKWYVGSDYDLKMSKAKDVVRGLEAQLDCIPKDIDESESLRFALIQEGAILSSITGFENNILDRERHVSGLKAKLQVCLERQSSGDLLRAEDSALSARIATFSLLGKACSNDGIIALELDDAAPAIASIVNELLRDCYGSRFSVRMETQAEKLDGSMKETFDIVVIDADTGTEQSITECSGGQNLWLEDSITRGICLFNIHRSDRVFGTMFSDERDGALDSERRRDFMAVKRKALEVGSHQREYFISHSPELVDMADARILVQRGGVVIA